MNERKNSLMNKLVPIGKRRRKLVAVKLRCNQGISTFTDAYIPSNNNVFIHIYNKY